MYLAKKTTVVISWANDNGIFFMYTRTHTHSSAGGTQKKILTAPSDVFRILQFHTLGYSHDLALISAYRIRIYQPY
jgi:hypothetical protein